jgi:hypothetical protein
MIKVPKKWMGKNTNILKVKRMAENPSISWDPESIQRMFPNGSNNEVTIEIHPSE